MSNWPTYNLGHESFIVLVFVTFRSSGVTFLCVLLELEPHFFLERYLVCKCRCDIVASLRGFLFDAVCRERERDGWWGVECLFMFATNTE